MNRRLQPHRGRRAHTRVQRASIHWDSVLGKWLLPGLLAVGIAIASGPVLSADPVVERSEKHDFRIVTLAEDLDEPWGLAFLPNGDMLVTERLGTLRLLSDRFLQPQSIGGVPEVVDRGQGGLLDVAVHPDFANNGLVYLS